jgi:hypothetical protein
MIGLIIDIFKRREKKKNLQMHRKLNFARLIKFYDVKIPATQKGEIFLLTKRKKLS